MFYIGSFSSKTSMSSGLMRQRAPWSRATADGREIYTCSVNDSLMFPFFSSSFVRGSAWPPHPSFSPERTRCWIRWQEFFYFYFIFWNSFTVVLASLFLIWVSQSVVYIVSILIIIIFVCWELLHTQPLPLHTQPFPLQTQPLSKSS